MKLFYVLVTAVLVFLAYSQVKQQGRQSAAALALVEAEQQGGGARTAINPRNDGLPIVEPAPEKARSGAPPASTSPGAAAMQRKIEAAPASAGPGSDLTERQRQRELEKVRVEMTLKYGDPGTYRGLVKGHVQDGRSLLVGGGAIGDSILVGHPKNSGIADGDVIDFEGWETGTDSYKIDEGKSRTVRRLQYCPPPLMLWNQYGKPINRDIYIPIPGKPAPGRERQEKSVGNPLEQRPYNRR